MRRVSNADAVHDASQWSTAVRKQNIIRLIERTAATWQGSCALDDDMT